MNIKDKVSTVGFVSLGCPKALVDSELQPSRGQARKTVASNAVTINGEKQADPEYVFSDSDRLFGRYTLLRRGKKNYCLVCWK